ncbi:MAG: hypothetical protein JWO45_662, partial [Spartobacteria bacterium]|nr:hypothetical protein [Spartobacteria bacterium]
DSWPLRIQQDSDGPANFVRGLSDAWHDVAYPIVLGMTHVQSEHIRTVFD